MPGSDVSSSSSDDPGQGVADIVTSKAMLQIGLELLGYDGKSVARANDRTNLERFVSNFSCSPQVCCNIYEDLQRTKQPSDRITKKNLKVKFFLMAFHHLKVYPTERQREATFHYCPSWARKKVWYYIQKIQALKSEKIVWPQFKDGLLWVVTVDGTHCWISEPTHPEWSQDSRYYSHKFNKAGLNYELAIDISSNRLVWMNGPFAAGMNDKKIFLTKGLLDKLIAGNRRAIGDGGYSGTPAYCSTPNNHDSRPVRKFKSRALKRHETFNGLTKTFGALQGRFRHSIDKFASTFESICVICQYQIENDRQLFDVLIEDVLNED